MKAALVVRRVPAEEGAGLRTIEDRTTAAARQGADLVLFPEAALTGLVNNDDPEHDLALGQPIPGPVSDSLARLAADHRIWLGTGLFERAENRLYDSAVLVSPAGEIGLRYRRIHPGWHGRRADPAIYGAGTELRSVETPFGSIAFLICGDLFDDSVVGRCRSLAPDFLLVPMVRSFDDDSRDQERWVTTEQPAYQERIRLIGSTALVVNSLAGPDEGSFGGAWIISGDGSLRESFPLGQEGILLASV